jgi:hypothetical protein
MIPYVKNAILASDDQVAIDAIAAKMMGIDPMSIKYIRLAHEKGLGVGDPSELEIVGDEAVAHQNWHFQGAFKEMTFASRMQHRIYWGPLKGPIEWSLKTVLAPWSYIASVLYHDTFWYPFIGYKKMQAALESGWGRMFRNWEDLTPDEQGYPDVGEDAAELQKAGWDVFKESFRILWMAIMEAPELTAHRRRREDQYYMQRHGQERSRGITLAIILLALPILILLMIRLRSKDNEG